MCGMSAGRTTRRVSCKTRIYETDGLPVSELLLMKFLF